MKRKICSVIAACLLFSTMPANIFGAISDITINVNGILQPIRTGIINKNGNNLVGIREISEILGADDVYWSSNDRSVKIKKDDKTVILYVDTGKATIDDEEVNAPVSAEIIDNSVFVPLRFVSEIFDSKVEWDSKKRTITITPSEKSDFIVLDTSSYNNKDTTVYTYDEALQSALDKNSELKNLDDTISYLTESRSQLGNNIKLMDDAYASYNFLLSGANGQGISDSTALQASLTSTIDSTIKIMQGMKTADVNKSLKDVNEEMIKDGAAVTLKNYLSSIKTAEMNIALMEENVKLGKENIDNLELKLSVGMESEQNVTTAKLDQKELESNLESAKISLDKLKESLKSFIGVDSNENITVDYDISFDQLKDVQLESYITLKKQNDPSIKTLKAQVDIAEYNKKIAVNSRTDAERQELTNAVNSATRKLSDAQDAMETNIRNAYNSIKQLEEQNKAKKAAVSKAIETYNSVVVSYQAGMATIYQVSQAKMGILNAEIAVEQNAIDYDMLVFTFQRPYMLSSN